MPLFEYECDSCGTRFEELVMDSETPACPACGANGPRRLYSSVSPPPKVGLRGLAARRSNAVRRAREEQRQERRAQRRDRDARG
jgi:putative FmdB family regulatory protein